MILQKSNSLTNLQLYFEKNNEAYKKIFRFFIMNNIFIYKYRILRDFSDLIELVKCKIISNRLKESFVGKWFMIKFITH